MSGSWHGICFRSRRPALPVPIRPLKETVVTPAERRRLIETPITFNVIKPAHGTAQSTSTAHPGFATPVYFPGRGWACEDSGGYYTALAHRTESF
jgi:hypothetical protein